MKKIALKQWRGTVSNLGVVTCVCECFLDSRPAALPFHYYCFGVMNGKCICRQPYFRSISLQPPSRRSRYLVCFSRGYDPWSGNSVASVLVLSLENKTESPQRWDGRRISQGLIICYFQKSRDRGRVEMDFTRGMPFFASMQCAEKAFLSSLCTSSASRLGWNPHLSTAACSCRDHARPYNDSLAVRPVDIHVFSAPSPVVFDKSASQCQGQHAELCNSRARPSRHIPYCRICDSDSRVCSEPPPQSGDTRSNHNTRWDPAWELCRCERFMLFILFLFFFPLLSSPLQHRPRLHSSI